MPIPENITRDEIIKAIEYIKQNKVPQKYQSRDYDLVYKGDKYPPKYTIAVADSLVNNREEIIINFNAAQARKFLLKLRFDVVAKPEINNDNEIEKNGFINPYSNILLN